MADVSDDVKNLCLNLKAFEEKPLGKTTPAGVAGLLRELADAIEKDDLACKLQGKAFPFGNVVVSMFGDRDKKGTMLGAVICNKANPAAVVSNLKAVVDMLISGMADNFMKELFKDTPMAESFRRFMKERGHDISE